MVCIVGCSTVLQAVFVNSFKNRKLTHNLCKLFYLYSTKDVLGCVSAWEFHGTGVRRLKRYS